MMKTKTKRNTAATTPMPKKRKTMISSKKRKTIATETKTTPQLNPIPSLPYDLLLSCIARLSRLYYPTLSLVSKSFRSLIASPELYKARSLLGKTESCLYVCFRGRKPQDRWFTLCRKPDQSLTNDTNKKSSAYVLVQVPNPHSRFADSSGLVAVGSNIYNIAGSGSIAQSLLPSFSILDCTSHTWTFGPSLPVKLCSFSASVLDRKIYLAGCYRDSATNSLKNSIQVFDTQTQIWDPELPTACETNGDLYSNTALIDGKLHLVTVFKRKVVAYNFKEGKWDLAEGKQRMSHYWSSDSYCEIDNVLYSVFDTTLRWYDTKVDKWRELEGLVGLPKFPQRASVKLANYGGKMAVLWDVRTYFSFGYYVTRVWCAEIVLERRENCQIWGTVEWCDHVLEIPNYDELVKLLAVTV